jgi:Protein of unknown function DUF45
LGWTHSCPPAPVALAADAAQVGIMLDAGNGVIQHGYFRAVGGVPQYVIVHELLHLKVPNHGKLFKTLLRAYIPDYEKIKPQPLVGTLWPTTS